MRRFLLVLVPLLLATGSCSLLEPEAFDDHRRRLHRATARWDAEGPASYRLVYERACFCGPRVVQPVEITVRDGEVVERRFVEEDAPVPDDLAELFLPVPPLFEEIQRAIDRRVAELRVSYDPTLGHPVEVVVDPALNVADDEVTHRVLELVPGTG